MKNNIVIFAVIALIIGGAAGFLGGMKYQESKSSSQQFGARLGNGAFVGGGNGNGRFGGRGGNGGGGAVVGEVISADDKSITIKLPDGSSKIVLVSDKTTINKASQGTLSDIKTGINVAVFGTTNSDGSVTGQNIQLNPNFPGRGSRQNSQP